MLTFDDDVDIGVSGGVVDVDVVVGFDATPDVVFDVNARVVDALVFVIDFDSNMLTMLRFIILSMTLLLLLFALVLVLVLPLMFMLVLMLRLILILLLIMIVLCIVMPLLIQLLVLVLVLSILI